MSQDIESLPKVNIQCPTCGTLYRIPLTQKLLRIQCQKCGKTFFNRRQIPQQAKKERRTSRAGIFVVAIIFLGLLLLFLMNQRPKTENWVTMDYANLVDGSILTHSGETVAQVVKKIPDYSEEIKGLVQPYLEPFSILCNDVLRFLNGPDTLPLVNILVHYPIGSRQPAWAAIAREGRFQVYYNNQRIRLFLQGQTPEGALDNYQSVIRHAVIDIKERFGKTLREVEVYVFRNDYAMMELSLNTIPKTYPIGDFDIAPDGKPVDLTSLEDFLSKGVIIEAMEVDADNELYAYGRTSKSQTIAGQAVSLSDIAVVYRSIFHYGYNAPYISLDKNEDNRFAKVNFGGLLQNTRIGHVVLEADKLFKTLSTGLDPNDHHYSSTITQRNIFGFLTEDERSFLEQQATGHSQIRYWFYPDSIGTVTDGSIGAVETNQFLADVERMDVKVGVTTATRNTISHLNNNFDKYANANLIYDELNTVGRIMGLMNWLYAMDFKGRVSVDDFLSVMLPPFETQATTKKMLTVSAIYYSENEPPNISTVHQNTKVFYLSNLLDNKPDSTSDEEFLKIAEKTLANQADLEPPEYRRLKNLATEYKQRIVSNEAIIITLEEDVNRQKYSLDQYNQDSVDRHNQAVDRYNKAVSNHKLYVDKYNNIIERLNGLSVQTRHIASIGGGIGMNPRQFKKVAWNSNSPRIQEIHSIKSALHSVGKESVSSNWIRNTITHSTIRANDLPLVEWSLSNNKNGNVTYSYTSPGGDYMNVTVSTEDSNWEAESKVNESVDVIRCSPTGGTFTVAHSAIGNATATEKSTKHFVFSR